MYLAAEYVEITTEKAGQRLDNFLMAKLKNVPKSRIYRAIRTGEVRINKGRTKPMYKIAAGDIVRVPPIRVVETKVNQANTWLVNVLKASILYEDEELLIINKPAGIAVHGGTGVDLDIIAAMRQITANDNIELVHRLDKGTSGCLMLTKKHQTLRMLHEKLRLGTINKKYLALVAGHWAKCAIVDAPLHKDQLRSGERMVYVAASGKRAITKFTVMQNFQQATLVTAEPETGRTHQIRVHAAFKNHPVLGDPKYGDKELNGQLKSQGLKRMFLHASALSFEYNLNTLTVEAPLPEELQSLLEKLQSA